VPIRYLAEIVKGPAKSHVGHLASSTIEHRACAIGLVCPAVCTVLLASFSIAKPLLSTLLIRTLECHTVAAAGCEAGCQSA
jgi:hypothetical protein